MAMMLLISDRQSPGPSRPGSSGPVTVSGSDSSARPWTGGWPGGSHPSRAAPWPCGRRPSPGPTPAGRRPGTGARLVDAVRTKAPIRAPVRRGAVVAAHHEITDLLQALVADRPTAARGWPWPASFSAMAPALSTTGTAPSTCRRRCARRRPGSSSAAELEGAEWDTSQWETGPLGAAPSADPLSYRDGGGDGFGPDTVPKSSS